MIYFTSDTHFSSQRTLELSRRPFETIDEMDQYILDKFNTAINKNIEQSVIYHLGDFGNHSFVKKINAPIIMVIGNYEEDEMNKEFDGDFKKYRAHLISTYGYKDVVKPGYEIFIDTIGSDENATKIIKESIKLFHKPTDGLKSGEDFFLFGHIHGRQKCKKFGTDVGVDANHFKLMTIDDVAFLKNAIEKFYDDDVWC